LLSQLVEQEFSSFPGTLLNEQGARKGPLFV